jgi:peptidoglycan-associated lipoprotein
MLMAHANYLKQNTAQKIIIQGNTDDRGTTEYNLALGQRRSDAVRKQLALLGVADNQMEAVSFGKEKPKADGNNEAAWAENRRADLVYITK